MVGVVLLDHVFLLVETVKAKFTVGVVLLDCVFQLVENMKATFTVGVVLLDCVFQLVEIPETKRAAVRIPGNI